MQLPCLPRLRLASSGQFTRRDALAAAFESWNEGMLTVPEARSYRFTPREQVDHFGGEG